MSKERFENAIQGNRRTFGVKSLVLVLACVLLFGGAIGGTLAWLMDASEPVVNTFTDSFEFTKETVSTLLADETTRNAYNVIMQQLSGEIRQVEDKLRVLTGLTKPQIKGKIISDFKLSATADWPDIFEKINELFEQRQFLNFLNACTYSDLFNDKVSSWREKVYVS